MFGFGSRCAGFFGRDPGRVIRRSGSLRGDHVMSFELAWTRSRGYRRTAVVC